MVAVSKNTPLLTHCVLQGAAWRPRAIYAWISCFFLAIVILKTLVIFDS